MIKQSQQLEVQVDKVKEDLSLMEEKLAEKEIALNNGELELAALAAVTAEAASRSMFAAVSWYSESHLNWVRFL